MLSSCNSSLHTTSPYPGLMVFGCVQEPVRGVPSSIYAQRTGDTCATSAIAAFHACACMSVNGSGSSTRARAALRRCASAHRGVRVAARVYASTCALNGAPPAVNLHAHAAPQPAALRLHAARPVGQRRLFLEGALQAGHGRRHGPSGRWSIGARGRTAAASASLLGWRLRGTAAPRCPWALVLARSHGVTDPRDINPVRHIRTAPRTPLSQSHSMIPPFTHYPEPVTAQANRRGRQIYGCLWRTTVVTLESLTTGQCDTLAVSDLPKCHLTSSCPLKRRNKPRPAHDRSMTTYPRHPRGLFYPMST